jgi:hypothetical protein
MKKNYSELPLYLNYLILNSNPILKKFFLQKVRDSEDFKYYIKENLNNENM